jgi:hypothetical protein
MPNVFVGEVPQLQESGMINKEQKILLLPKIGEEYE